MGLAMIALLGAVGLAVIVSVVRCLNAATKSSIEVMVQEALDPDHDKCLRCGWERVLHETDEVDAPYSIPGHEKCPGFER